MIPSARAPRRLRTRLDRRLFEACVRLAEIAKGDTRYLEMGFGSFTLWWSFPLLFLDGRGFDAPAWDVFRCVLVPAYVGPIGTLIGAARFVGLGFDWWPVRFLSAASGFVFWLSIAASSFMHDASGTGWRAYGFYCFWNGVMASSIFAGRPRAPK